jgi:hypothetical protein
LYKDPYAKVYKGQVFTRDQSTRQDSVTGVIYEYNPFAFNDPRTNNVYQLVTAATMVVEEPESLVAKIYVESPNAFKDSLDGYTYTADPHAVLDAETGTIYTMSGVEPADVAAPVLPEVGLSNPIVDVLGNIIVFGDKLTIEGIEYVIFDPTKQHFKSEVVSVPVEE